MHDRVITDAPAEGFDTGRFVGRYLQAWAVLAAVWMVAEPLFIRRFDPNPMPLLLWWAGSGLKRRSRTARFWVVGVSGLTLCIVTYLVGRAVLVGTDDLTIRIGGPIRGPALWQVLVHWGTFGALIAVPFGVLLSKRACRQFGPILDERRFATDRESNA